MIGGAGSPYNLPAFSAAMQGGPAVRRKGEEAGTDGDGKPPSLPASQLPAVRGGRAMRWLWMCVVMLLAPLLAQAEMPPMPTSRS